MGFSDAIGSCLLERVVRISLESIVGSRSSSRSRNSEMEVEGDRGSTRVGGNPRPPKLVMRTLRFRGVMIINLEIYDSRRSP